MLALICSCLQQPGETVRSQVFESLACWLKLSNGANLPPGLPESPLVQAALQGLKVDGTFYAATDAVSLFLVAMACNCRHMCSGEFLPAASQYACPLPGNVDGFYAEPLTQ